MFRYKKVSLTNYINIFYYFFKYYILHPLNMFICKVCELQYNSKSGYNKHIRTKHVKFEKKTYTCNNCDTLFYNKKLLINHLKNEMQLTQIYKQICSFENCNKVFKTFKMYSNHLETIHKINIGRNKLHFNTIEGTCIFIIITLFL